MSEWFKELVLKTSDSERGRGFESHPLRHNRLRGIRSRKGSSVMKKSGGLLNSEMFKLTE